MATRLTWSTTHRLTRAFCALLAAVVFTAASAAAAGGQDAAPQPQTLGGHAYYSARLGPFFGGLIGLPGWRITASLVGVDGWTASTVTNAVGAYAFSRDALGPIFLPGATVRICAEGRPGWRRLAPRCRTVLIPYPLPADHAFPAIDFITAPG